MELFAWINLVWNFTMLIVFTIGHYWGEIRVNNKIYVMSCIGPVIGIILSLLVLNA